MQEHYDRCKLLHRRTSEVSEGPCIGLGMRWCLPFLRPWSLRQSSKICLQLIHSTEQAAKQ